MKLWRPFHWTAPVGRAETLFPSTVWIGKGAGCAGLQRSGFATMSTGRGAVSGGQLAAGARSCGQPAALPCRVAGRGAGKRVAHRVGARHGGGRPCPAGGARLPAAAGAACSGGTLGAGWRKGRRCFPLVRAACRLCAAPAGVGRQGAARRPSLRHGLPRNPAVPRSDGPGHGGPGAGTGVLAGLASSRGGRRVRGHRPVRWPARPLMRLPH